MGKYILILYFMLFSFYNSVLGQKNKVDPIILQLIDHYVDSVQTENQRENGVIIVELKNYSLYDLNSDFVENHSKIEEISCLIYSHNDQFFLRDMPPSLSFFHRQELVLLYSGIEPMLDEDLFLKLPTRATKIIKKLPNSGSFDRQVFLKAFYSKGNFNYETTSENIQVILTGNRWRIEHFR